MCTWRFLNTASQTTFLEKAEGKSQQYFADLGLIFAPSAHIEAKLQKSAKN
jgi:hypothetical protein